MALDDWRASADRKPNDLKPGHSNGGKSTRRLPFLKAAGREVRQCRGGRAQSQGEAQRPKSLIHRIGVDRRQIHTLLLPSAE